MVDTYYRRRGERQLSVIPPNARGGFIPRYEKPATRVNIVSSNGHRTDRTRAETGGASLKCSSAQSGPGRTIPFCDADCGHAAGVGKAPGYIKIGAIIRH